MIDVLSGLPVWLKLASGVALVILFALVGWGGGEWRVLRTPKRGVLMVLRWHGLRRKHRVSKPEPRIDTPAE